MKPTRVFDFVTHQAENYPREDALASKVNGQWKAYSLAEVQENANKLSHGLLKLGVAKDNKVAIVSENRPEWNFVDLATQQIGAVSVPMYPTITIEDYRYIIGHADVTVIFASSTDLYQKVKTALDGNEAIKVYTFDEVEGAEHWTAVRDLNPDGDDQDIEALKAQVTEDDLLTIIYTSGTTGRPKGVMLTHKNIVSNSLAASKVVLLDAGKSRALSFLPLSHIYERTGIYFYLYLGVSVYYAESIDKIADNLKEVKPHTFNTVPRLLEKVFDKIVAKGKELSGGARKLFFWALDLAHEYDPNKNQGFVFNLKLKVARKLIFSKWREALGGELFMLSSGGAALQPRLARIFWAAGIKVCEGYGLTETSPIITASIATEKDIRIGQVGAPIEGVEIKIAEDGEILCRGNNVMKGYYKAPDKTAEVLKDGWFHTGDIGEISEGRFLRITDRKKEMFKTSGGKYVAPQLIENKFKESLYIEQCIVIGDGRKFPSALIVPNFDALKKWCEEVGHAYTSDEDIVKDERVLAHIETEIKPLNGTFAQWEQVKRYALLTQPFTIETGEMTAKLSMKRRVIHKKYEEKIEALYNV